MPVDDVAAPAVASPSPGAMLRAWIPFLLVALVGVVLVVMLRRGGTLEVAPL